MTIEQYVGFCSAHDHRLDPPPGGGGGGGGGSSLYIIAGGDATVLLETSLDSASFSSISTPLDGASAGAFCVMTDGTNWVTGVHHLSSGAPSIMSSPDGTTWTTRSSSMDSGITFGGMWDGTRFIATGLDGSFTAKIDTSPDGIVWTNAYSLGGVIAFRRISYNNTDYMVVDYLGGLHKSSNLSSWTTPTVPLTITSRILWDGSQWLLGGYGNPGGGTYKCIATSPDGTTWTAQSSPFDTASPSSNQPAILDFATSGSLIVAVGRNDGYTEAIMTSPDGVNWTYRASPMDAVPLTAQASAIWDGSQFLVVGGTMVMTSPNGTTWTSHAHSFSSKAVEDIAYHS